MASKDSRYCLGVAPLLYILAGSGHLNVKLNDTH